MSVTGVGRSAGVGGAENADGAATVRPTAETAATPAPVAVRGTAPRDPLAAVTATTGKPDSWITMYGFDQVAAKLGSAAGADHLLSRDEAEGAVSSLRDAGRGAEAQAARAIVRDFPQAVRADGSIDLGKARQLIEMWTQAGAGAASPLGRVLLDVGKFAGLPPRAGRIAARVPESGLDHAAALLQTAAGRDGRTTSSEAKKLVEALEKGGRGAEALAVQLLYGLAGGHDGSKITSRQLELAAAGARDKLRAIDTNRNGLSAAETAGLTMAGKAFLEVGRRIEAGLIARPGALDQGAAPAGGGAGGAGGAGTATPTATALAKQLDKLALGLLFTSESDYPFAPFSKPLDPATPLDAAAMREVLGESDTYPIDMRSGEEWLRYDIDEAGYEGADLDKWKALEAGMKANLTDLKLVYAGPADAVQGKVYVVGRAPDGSVVGLSSTRIWT